MTANKNVKHLLRNSLPSASKQEVQSAGDRVLERLQSDPDRMPARALPFNEAPNNSRRWVPVLTMAAAIAIVVLIPLAMLHRAPAVPAVMEDAAGSRRIQFDEVVRATDSAGSTIVLADTSRVEMRANSELSLERADDGVRIQLRSGDIIVNAAKQHGHLYVQTKDVTVSVVGTVFLVKAEAEGSRVAVIEGEVHVQQDGTETKLHPGEQVMSNPKMEPLSVKQEIVWSSQAVTHMALLQQAAPKERLAFELASIRMHRTGSGDGRGGGGGNNVDDGCAFATPQIDPRRFALTDTNIWTLLTIAYTGIPDPQACADFTSLNFIVGAPGWIKSDKWDVEALIPEGVDLSVRQRFEYGLSVPILSKEGSAKLQKMILALLEERLKLVVRRETKEVPAYALMLESGATPKFTVTSFPRSTYGSGIDDPRFKTVWDRISPGMSGPEGGSLMGKEVHMADLARLLQPFVSRPVVDRTGFTDTFSFLILFRPAKSTADYLAVRPNIFEAIMKQTGLQLEETKTTAEFWTIEHLEKPSEN